MPVHEAHVMLIGKGYVRRITIQVSTITTSEVRNSCKLMIPNLS